MTDLRAVRDSEDVIAGQAGDYTVTRSPDCGVGIHLRCPACGTRAVPTYVVVTAETPLTIAPPFTCPDDRCHVTIAIEGGVCRVLR